MLGSIVCLRLTPARQNPRYNYALAFSLQPRRAFAPHAPRTLHARGHLYRALGISSGFISALLGSVGVPACYQYSTPAIALCCDCAWFLFATAQRYAISQALHSLSIIGLGFTRFGSCALSSCLRFSRRHGRSAPYTRCLGSIRHELESPGAQNPFNLRGGPVPLQGRRPCTPHLDGGPLPHQVGGGDSAQAL